MSQTASSSSINNPENATQSNQPEVAIRTVPPKYVVFEYQGAPNFTITLEEISEPGALFTYVHVQSPIELFVYEVVFMVPSKQDTTKHSGVLLPPLKYITAEDRPVTLLALPSSFILRVREEVNKAWMGMGRLEKIKPYTPWKITQAPNLQAPEGFEYTVAVWKKASPNAPNQLTGTYDGALSFFVIKRVSFGVVNVELVVAFLELEHSTSSKSTQSSGATSAQASNAQSSGATDTQASNVQGSIIDLTNIQESSTRGCSSDDIDTPEINTYYLGF
ncbi:hypothetical protein sscle_13g096060 [Sclerotinia sclerotiorum 1980 UF-70]|uniref:Uncharacterized protein n=1 Tax=Sclerotinia sclerotiorum (strain ATCC 18683 / 1980 / Ss-1) TaxID=665079 RepID=A0A1D9QIS8_SCLS1|nr:hypothetical protein sscle_13g096060 [Sclerotinia sclerotiorum 1980 UF-70]